MEALTPRVSEEDPDVRRFQDDVHRFRTALSSPTSVFDVQRGAFVASSVARGVEGFTRLIPVFDGPVEARADVIGRARNATGPSISA